MRLRRSVVSGPGLRRVRRGRGFSYHDSDGHVLTDRATLERIQDLVIPPAWKNVWISTHPNGHIQAVGTDAAGRRQYLYHEKWQEERNEEKFDRVLEMSTALPDMRRRIAADLRRRGLEARSCSRLGPASFGPRLLPGRRGAVRRREQLVRDRDLALRSRDSAAAGHRVRLSRQERCAPHADHRRPRGGPIGARPAAKTGSHRPPTGMPQFVGMGQTFTPTTSTPGSRSSLATSTPSRTCARGTAPCWRRWPSSTPTRR